MGYRVASVTHCRPDGVVHRKVPPGSCSAFHPGCCLSLWSLRHFGPPLHRHDRPLLHKGCRGSPFNRSSHKILARPTATTTASRGLRPSAPLKWRPLRGVVFEVALCGGSAAAWPGAGGVPDLGQVAELDPGIMALGLESVIAVAGGDRVEGDGQVWLSGCAGVQLPGAVSVVGWPVPAGGGEGEPGPVPGPAGRVASVQRPGFPAFLAVSPGSWPGAAVADGVSLLVGDGDAPRGGGVLRGGVRQVAGQVGVIQSRSKYTNEVSRTPPSEAS